MNETKIYKTVELTTTEKACFSMFLVRGKQYLEQAIEKIDYPEFPEINKNPKSLLKDIVDLIEIANEMPIAKPIEINEPAEKSKNNRHFYELVYFENRRNSGSVYICTPLDKDDFVDDDDFLEELVATKCITAGQADSIVNIIESDQDHYERLH